MLSAVIGFVLGALLLVLKEGLGWGYWGSAAIVLLAAILLRLAWDHLGRQGVKLRKTKP